MAKASNITKDYATALMGQWLMRVPPAKGKLNNLPFVELLDKKWKISIASSPGEGYTDFEKKVLHVPVDASACSERTRFHELAHVKWTPGDREIPAGLPAALVNASEDLRVNAHLAAVDPGFERILQEGTVEMTVDNAIDRLVESRHRDCVNEKELQAMATSMYVCSRGMGEADEMERYARAIGVDVDAVENIIEPLYDPSARFDDTIEVAQALWDYLNPPGLGDPAQGEGEGEGGEGDPQQAPMPGDQAGEGQKGRSDKGDQEGEKGSKAEGEPGDQSGDQDGQQDGQGEGTWGDQQDVEGDGNPAGEADIPFEAPEQPKQEFDKPTRGETITTDDLDDILQRMGIQQQGGPTPIEKKPAKYDYMKLPKQAPKELRSGGGGKPPEGGSEGLGRFFHEKLQLHATHTGYATPGVMQILRPPLDERITKHMHRPYTKRQDYEGGEIRQLHRVHLDEKIMRRKAPLRTRKLVGTLLIDVSGSMSMTVNDIDEVLSVAPQVTVAIYSSNGVDRHLWPLYTNTSDSQRHYSDPHDYSVGHLAIIAHRGKRISSNKIKKFIGGNNIVDTEAVRWLTQQPRPRFWICDGNVTGMGHCYGLNIKQEIEAMVKRSNIAHIHSVNEFLRSLRHDVAKDGVAPGVSA